MYDLWCRYFGQRILVKSDEFLPPEFFEISHSSFECNDDDEDEDEDDDDDDHLLRDGQNYRSSNQDFLFSFHFIFSCFFVEI